jgi:hypothetical protein
MSKEREKNIIIIIKKVAGLTSPATATPRAPVKAAAAATAAATRRVTSYSTGGGDDDDDDDDDGDDDDDDVDDEDDDDDCANAVSAARGVANKRFDATL